MKKRTQVDRLISYLKRHKRGITTLEAATKLGICSLQRRIADAWAEGHVISGYPEKSAKARYLRYRLLGSTYKNLLPSRWGVAR